MDITRYVSSEDIISQLRLYYGYPTCNTIDFNKYLGTIKYTQDGYLSCFVRNQIFIIDPITGVIIECYEGGR